MHSNPNSQWTPSSEFSPQSQQSWTNSMESSPYCGYPANYWYPPPPPAGHYGNAYPSAPELNGQAAYNAQAMPAYPNGVYNPGQYPPNVLHPSSPFYCSEQIPPGQPQYHNQERPAAASPQPPYPVPHCQTTPGYPPSSYPTYGDGCPPTASYAPPQALPSQTQHEPWPHTAAYQHQGHYTNHTRPPHPPPWQGPAPPPYDHIKHKEPPYPGPAHVNPRNQTPGPKPRPGTPNSNPSPGQSKPTEYSAPPQMYTKTPSAGGTQPKPAPNPEMPNPTAAPQQQLHENPSLAQVQQVLFRVEMLQNHVDEFVGKKTDKNYRCLEELLTKELLVLDSVETNGQEAVRQARKEAVQRIQIILDRLEKKAF